MTGPLARLLKPPSVAEFPNRLSTPTPAPAAGRLEPATWTLLSLLLLCLASRAAMAWKLDVMCPDGAFFVGFAQRLLDGHAGAAGNYDLNVYPVILACLRRLGLDWHTAGKVWGVACGSLVVLPLFGWMRRMFNRQVATVGCLLYTVHPKLIEWSPELVRESTFWLFFTLSLYWFWRAVTEVRPLWFGLSGLTCGLAINTRFEGWFLLITFGLWTAWRFLSLSDGRRRLTSGVAIHALCFPLVLVVLMSAHGHSHWHWGSFHRLKMVLRFIGAEEVPHAAPVAARRPAPRREIAAAPNPRDPATSALPEARPSLAARPAPATPPPPRMPPVQVIWGVLHTLERGFTPMFGALMLVGHIFLFRVWLRRDMQAMFYWSLATLAGMSVHLWASQESSSRYAMGMVLLSMPFAAVGVLQMAALAGWLTERIVPSGRSFAHNGVALTLLLASTIVGLVDAYSSKYHGRNARADMGAWIQERYGDGAVIVGSHRWKYVGFFAGGNYFEVPDMVWDDCRGNLRSLVACHHPDVVLLYPKQLHASEVPGLVEECRSLGLERVPPEQTPVCCRGVLFILEQAGRRESIAGRR